jgi:hypothetical protein
MAFFDPPEPPSILGDLCRATMSRAAEMRGRVDRGDERPLGPLAEAEATGNVCVLASACSAIVSPDAYSPGMVADVLFGAEHAATVGRGSSTWLGSGEHRQEHVGQLRGRRRPTFADNRLAIGAAAVGLAGKEGDVFRRVLGWSVILLLAMCVIVLLQSTGLFDWMVVGG